MYQPYDETYLQKKQNEKNQCMHFAEKQHKLHSSLTLVANLNHLFHILFHMLLYILFIFSYGKAIAMINNNRSQIRKLQQLIRLTIFCNFLYNTSSAIKTMFMSVLPIVVTSVRHDSIMKVIQLVIHCLPIE